LLIRPPGVFLFSPTDDHTKAKLKKTEKLENYKRAIVQADQVSQNLKFSIAIRTKDKTKQKN